MENLSKQIFKDKSLIDLFVAIQKQDSENIILKGIENCFIVSEEFPNIVIKPYINNLEPIALNLISDKQIKPDFVDAECVDFCVSMLVKNSESNETVFNTISLSEFILMNSIDNKNFIFAPCWNLYIL